MSTDPGQAQALTSLPTLDDAAQSMGESRRPSSLSAAPTQTPPAPEAPAPAPTEAQDESE